MVTDMTSRTVLTKKEDKKIDQEGLPRVVCRDKMNPEQKEK